MICGPLTFAAISSVQNMVVNEGRQLSTNPRLGQWDCAGEGGNCIARGGGVRGRDAFRADDLPQPRARSCPQTPPPAKCNFARKGVPKQSLGTSAQNPEHRASRPMNRCAARNYFGSAD